MQQKQKGPFALLVLLTSLFVAFASTLEIDAPPTAAATITAVRDADRDGIPDLFDLCPREANTGSPDRDGDGTKDRCDLDPEGDGRWHVVFDGRVVHMDGSLAN